MFYKVELTDIGITVSGTEKVLSVKELKCGRSSDILRQTFCTHCCLIAIFFTFNEKCLLLALTRGLLQGQNVLSNRSVLIRGGLAAKLALEFH